MTHQPHRRAPRAAVTALALALTTSSTGPAGAQDEAVQRPPTPEEIVAIRRELAARQRAEVQDPEDIEALRQLTLDEQQALDATGYSIETARRPVPRFVRVVTDGPATPFAPQTLTLHDGLVTAMSFFTDTGEAWPVEEVSFDQRALSVQGEGCEANIGTGGRLTGLGNVVSVLPCAFWTQTSMQVLLLGETRPILFDVASGSREAAPEVDGTVTVAVSTDTERPFGRDRTGRLDNAAFVPAARTLTIDPIDRPQDRTVNAIRLGTGVVTDVSFVDSGGNPYPVERVVHPAGIVAVNGSCTDIENGQVNVELGEAETIYVSPCVDARATIAVKLAGRSAALSLLTIPARSGVAQPDGTLTVTVPGSSPVAARLTPAAAAAPGSPVAAGRLGAGFNPDRYLDDFLYGAPPQGSRRAHVTGADGIAEGWVFDGALYLRGYFQVVNPAHDAQASSPDGSVNVWKYAPPVSRILAVTLDGREFVMTVDQ